MGMLNFDNDMDGLAVVIGPRCCMNLPDGRTRQWSCVELSERRCDPRRDDNLIPWGRFGAVLESTELSDVRSGHEIGTATEELC